MMETLTESEIRTLYERKQAEPFPVRKNVMGILLATVYLLGSVAVWGLFLWGLLVIAR